MEPLSLNELRERYLSFFESKGHLRLPSFPLVPQGDGSLLLINAGMAPLKPYFTGERVPPRKRVTTCQKCVRTLDIDNVGKTARHGTFFEMLGNFSFGDYFKQQAIPWAWEFLTRDLKIPADRLYPSVYVEDDEAIEVWEKTGVSRDRIVRLGKDDNFWEIGAGPCGPCSEIYFDRGEQFMDVLSEYVRSQPPKIRYISVILHPDGSCTLTDDSDSRIDCASCSDDSVLSLLISLAPERITVYDLSGNSDSLLSEALMRVFVDRVHFF